MNKKEKAKNSGKQGNYLSQIEVINLDVARNDMGAEGHGWYRCFSRQMS